MKIPREVSGEELIRRLGKLGYKPTRQTGSHVRLTRISDKGEHHITVPVHKTLRIGTLNNILTDGKEGVTPTLLTKASPTDWLRRK